MGGLLSSRLEDLPTPKKTYSPKSIEKHDEIEANIKETLISVNKLVPLGSAVARVVGCPADILCYVMLLKSVVDLLSSGNSIEIIAQKIVKEESARSAFANLNAKIKTIHSRLIEMFDEHITEEAKRSKASIAVDKCEEILNLFDDPNYVLWEMGVISSSILLSFSLIFGNLIKFCYENSCLTSDQSKILKARLIAVLMDYKKQCILNRLSYVYVVMGLETGGGRDTTTYQLGHEKFESDHDLEYIWYTYTACDKWDNLEKQRTSYKSIISYRKTLFQYYENDFDDVIGAVKNQLVEIESVQVAKTKKEFCKQQEIFFTAPFFQ